MLATHLNGNSGGHSLLAGQDMYMRSYAQKQLLGDFFFSKVFLLRFSNFMCFADITWPKESTEVLRLL